MSKLNPTLYNLLRTRLGEVRVANEGEAMVGEYKNDPVKGCTVLDIEAWGETYCVNCPYCHESRQRLCINHRYGVYDDISLSHNSHMVRCFNEECLQRDSSLFKDLYDKVYGLLNPTERRSVSYLRGKKPVIDNTKLVEASPPGEIELFCDLPSSHPAILYLESRGYDIVQLIERWNLLYCHLASPKYPLAQDRIIIPIIQNDMCVGWQGRYVGDIDWKAARVPKYYTLPSMPKRIILYNHDIALKQSMIIITEGPTSCWTVWPYGVAILGKQATIQQQRMILKAAADKPIVILLDSDAQYEAEKLYKNLKPYAKVGLVRVQLPEDRDPGSYLNSEDELWEIVALQAKGQGVNIDAVIASRP